MRHLLICLIICICLFPVGGLIAQDTTPSQAAEAIRQALFEAQVASMAGDEPEAIRAVEAADQHYQAVIGPHFASAAPDVHAVLLDSFEQAYDALQEGNVARFTATRSQVWTSLLAGSSEVVFSAVSEGDSETAVYWLPLRDFRVSTRFSRPGADATLAVNTLRDGQLDSSEALAVVRADLWDTYQAQLNLSLSDADEALNNEFGLRQAEEAALAAGYFKILAQAYGEQRSEAAQAELETVFVVLVESTVAGDTEAYRQAREQITTSLSGFRAAPLSEQELIRRAGQLMRFTALIPIEYERGVRNGVVTSDIEIQEALSFYQGATSALADLQSYLIEYDAQVAGEIDTLFRHALEQIRQVADPGELQLTIDDINQHLNVMIPEDWRSGGGASDIDVILSVLDQVGKAAIQGDYTRAESARLEAYALLELGIEQRLRGFDLALAVHIESLFWQGTNDQAGLAVLLAEQAPSDAVKNTLTGLESAFDETRLLLDSARSAPTAVAGNAAIIVFREGLEAVLILASLLASLRTVEQRRYRRPLIAGAVLASGATLLTWWAATRLLTILLPLGEKLEAIVSLIAIGVLLLITNWFFHKAYWTGWMANFHVRKQKLVGGMVAITLSQTIGLMLLGFTSIYREGFETVLFLQSLVLEAGIPVVLQGVALGLLGTTVVGVVVFALQVRLPYKKMLVVTGVMIGAVLLTMVGHTVHVLQSVGWLPITPIANLYLPYWMGQWFGLFATWQSIVLQVTAATFVIGSYFLAEHHNKRQRTSRASGTPETQAVG